MDGSHFYTQLSVADKTEQWRIFYDNASLLAHKRITDGDVLLVIMMKGMLKSKTVCKNNGNNIDHAYNQGFFSHGTPRNGVPEPF
jgi:hypothetical protein